MNGIQNHIFFLGGYDAEMLSIKKILEQYNLTFYDQNLSWGAKLSDYDKELRTLPLDKIPVLIELAIDISHSSNAIIIDHHNQDETKKSSIEQVADLLGIKLNRWQQLIAANDKGYIPALECLNATKDEINKVRKVDREAQGVTEEEEKLAEESIKKNLTIENGITVIKSLTSKFSPITDRMYGKTNQLLIYNSSELSFYGSGKEQLIKKYENHISKKKAYYGGGDYGFFGFEKGVFSEKEIENFKKEIVKINLNNGTPISHHIFLFPFQWDLKSNDTVLEETSFKDRTNLQGISDIIKNSAKDNDGITWQDFQFRINRPRDYNEFNYFYEYVTSVLFDCDRDDTDSDQNKRVILQYNLKLEKNESKYLINIVEREIDDKTKIDEITYELVIEDIIINFYQTGVGILSFHLSNYKYEKPEEILDINDFGRRIYPQFLDDLNQGNPLKNTKAGILANYISLQLKTAPEKNIIEIKDCFDKFCSICNNTPPQKISKLPAYITRLLGENFKETEDDIKIGEVKLKPVIDDRMFTICWYGNDKFSAILKEKLWSNELSSFKYNYERNELWNRFIFVDNRSIGLANNNFLYDLNIGHTYSRWADNGSFYGISRYSFVLLTDRNFFSKNILLAHMQTVYFQLVMLALLQRASIIRFSNEATKVKIIKKDGNKRKFRQGLEYVEQLYERYLNFVNKIYFREPSSQEQGIELYNMLMEEMRIEREVKDLNRELDEIHKYVSLLYQQEENSEIRLLTKLATVLLPASLVAGILGMGTMPQTSDISKYLFNGNIHPPLIISLILIVLSILLAMGVIRLSKIITNKSKK